MDRWQHFAELSNAEGWFWETDEEHCFTWMSDSVERLTGLPPEWYYGKSGVEIRRDGVDDLAWEEHLRQLANHEPFENFVFDRASPDGNRVLSTSGAAYRDQTGRFLGYRGIGEDRTSHYRMASQVNLLGGIIDNIDENVVIWDENDRLVNGNKTFWDLNIGSRDQIHLGMLYEAYLTATVPNGEFPDAVGREEEWIAQRLVQHRHPSETFEVTRKDGRVLQVREQRLKNGYTVQVSSETTEKNRLLQDAIIARDRLADFAECASDWYWEQDADHRFTMISEANFMVTGQRNSVFIGKTRKENPNISATEEEWARHDAALATRSPLVDFRMQSIDPTTGTRDLTMFGKPIFNAEGQFAGYRGIGRDITKQSETDRTLAASEHGLRESRTQLQKQVHLFESLVATTREGFWNIDIQGRTIDINPAMAEILGRPRTDVLGKTIFDFVDVKNRGVFEEQLANRREGEAASYEITLSRPDGSTVDCINSATPIHDMEGNKIGSIGLWTDIRAQKQTQLQLEEAREQAESANAAKSEFLSSMSHELRTPLNAIIGFSQLLEMDPDIIRTADNAVAVENISRSGYHLLDLINEILDLSRIEAGQAAMSIEGVDIGSVLTDCLTTVSSMVEQRNISIHNQVSTNCWMMCDPVRVKQVLLNFLSNAIKYNKPGGRITLSNELLENQFLRLKIQDTGHGISSTDFSKIFEPFERIAHAENGIEGTGIGLSITKRIVEAMDGSVGFTSEVGEGSIFWFDLPATSPLEQNRGTPAMGPTSSELIGDDHPSEQAKTVLYIEDNPANQLLMEMILARMGYIKLIIAHSGELGLHLTKTECPDLILLDVNLPLADGFEVLRQLRASDATRAIPVIGVSANSMGPDIEQARSAGFDAYITKPFNISDIHNVVENFISPN